MERRYQLILFDLDGALTDPKPDITRAAQRIIAHYGLDAYSSEVVGSLLDLTRSDKALVIVGIFDAYPEVAREPVMMVGACEHDMIDACAHRIDAIGSAHGYGLLTELLATEATSVAPSVDELEAPLA